MSGSNMLFPALTSSLLGWSLGTSSSFSLTNMTGPLGAIFGLSYFVIDTCVKDHVLDYLSNAVEISLAEEDSLNHRKKSILLGLRIADFAIKAFASWAIISTCVIAVPISSAIFICTATKIWTIFLSSILKCQLPSAHDKDQEIKPVSKAQEKITFDDVAGCAEAKKQFKRVIEFIKDPARSKALGAKMSKGILFSGPPGTGKTLLAKAFASEINRPFFYACGSEFMVRYVGAGPEKVRALFAEAKKQAPAVIFIDEVDSFACTRGEGSRGGKGSGEVEILNQFLTEMDGFSSNEDVFIIVASNRKKALDPAFTRDGRFDHKVTIELPDREARLAILEVHARKFILDEEVSLGSIADRTGGCSGAALAGILNEAGMIGVEKGRSKILSEDLEEACSIKLKERKEFNEASIVDKLERINDEITLLSEQVS